MTLRLESGNYLCFQVDTGAQYNFIPLELDKSATEVFKLVHVNPAKTQITAYEGPTLYVVCTVLVRAWRGDFRCQLDSHNVKIPEAPY